MKKFIAIVMIMVMALTLCACNENWGFGNYSWRHVHFTDNVEGHCATISSWHDNTTGIELHTVECGSMFLSEGSYVLFESAGDCPFCGE
jgi:hypothetical protein